MTIVKYNLRSNITKHNLTATYPTLNYFQFHFVMSSSYVENWRAGSVAVVNRLLPLFAQVMCYQPKVRLKNPECLTASKDLKPEPRGKGLLACKQAYYKKLKLEPLGVQCPQSWNSKTTAVSVVGALAALTGG